MIVTVFLGVHGKWLIKEILVKIPLLIKIMKLDVLYLMDSKMLAETAMIVVHTVEEFVRKKLVEMPIVLLVTSATI